MNWKLKWGVGIFALLGAYGAGRMTAPESVKIVKEEVVVHAKETEVKKDENKAITEKKKITTFPDGRRVEEVQRRSRSKSGAIARVSEQGKVSISDKEEKISAKARRSLSALVGVSIPSAHGSPFTYGVHLSAPVLGPFTIGAWFIIPGPTLGASVGVQF